MSFTVTGIGKVVVVLTALFVLLSCNGLSQVECKRQARRSVLFSGWQYQAPQPNQYFFPRTDSYYYRMKPVSEAVIEIIMDPEPTGEDVDYERPIVEHSSITTSIRSQAEYKASCVKEPGCRWECEPRQDELPPDCDCVCFYTDAKWDHIP